MREAVLLKSAFRYPNRRLLFARARLYRNRIELRGLGWTGWHRETIRLEDVERLDWWAGATDDVNLALHLADGRTVSLRVDGAGVWKFEIEALVGRSLSDPASAGAPLESAA